MSDKTYHDVTREGDVIEGWYSYDDEAARTAFSANWSLFRIDEASGRSDEAARRIWDLQDGYGEPGYTPEQGWDWSGIRDSSPEAVVAMDAVAAEYVSDADMERMLGL